MSIGEKSPFHQLTVGVGFLVKLPVAVEKLPCGLKEAEFGG
jgi:hypothetical protein